MEPKIEDKNVLLLISAADNQYLKFHDAFLRKRIKNVYRVDFTDHAIRNGIRETERHIRSLIAEKNIDMVFAFPLASSHELSVEFYASLKSGAQLVFWMFDDEIYFDDYSKYYCQLADAVVTTDLLAVPAYSRLGIHAVLYFSSHSREFYRPAEKGRDIDVSFVGNCDKSDRREHLEFLTKNGIAVQSFGAGSPNGHVPLSMVPEIFSRSRINLNFTKIDKPDWTCRENPLLSRVRQNKGRPIEIAMTGAFCLSEYSPTVKDVFVPGREIDVFNNKEELLEKVRYYLSHQEEREAMARSAYDRAVANYAAEVYLPRVLNAVNEIAAARTAAGEILLSGTFKVTAVGGLTFLLLIQLRRGRLFAAAETFFRLFRYGVPVFIKGFTASLARAAALGARN